MTTLSVPDMHCPKCVARISTALDEANIPFEISLESRTVSVDDSKVSETIDHLDDLGFETSPQ